MTTTPTDAPESPRSDGSRDLGHLRRSRTDRHIAGVAGGLARHLDIDPIIVRISLVVLVFFGGAGLLLYAAGWLFVPEEDSDAAIVRLDDRSRSFVLYVVAALAVLAILGDTIGHVDVPWVFFIPALIVLVVLLTREQAWGGLLRMPRRARRSDDAVAAAAVTPEAAAYSSSDVPPAATGPAPPMPPAPNPRRRGPILFWFTLALIALAEGVLGLVDLAGATIAGPAYAALAVGIIGLMLVLGAFWGRAGGLILIGFIAGIVLAGSLAADKWDLDAHSRTVSYTPASAAAVRTDYRMGTGDLRLDLTRLSDPAALAGHAITLTGHVGSIEVVLPDGIAAEADARIKGPGHVEVFDEDSGGFHRHLTGSVTGTNAGQPLYINAELNVGEITVETR
jgi:phage shock protein PspC (stress-responsive transcriptional regulator)